jgi:hypothetical protein
LRLEVPPVTVADHCATVAVALAGGMLALALLRQGFSATGGASLGAAVAIVAALRGRLHRRTPVRLERSSDGTLCAVCRDSTTLVPVSLKPQTALLGSSVYVDFEYCVAGRPVRCRRWIGRLDAPADTLRRWTVVLPRAGRVATS